MSTPTFHPYLSWDALGGDRHSLLYFINNTKPCTGNLRIRISDRNLLQDGSVWSHQTPRCNKNIERHTAHTIVSWPYPKQWKIVHTSNLIMIIRQSVYFLSHHKGNGYTEPPPPPYNIQWITEKIRLILLTHSTKQIWQAFYKFNVFRYVCTMMIMRWCNVQTKEHDLQAKTYPTICTHPKLTTIINTKSQFSRNVYAISDRMWCNKHLRHTTTEKSGNG